VGKVVGFPGADVALELIACSVADWVGLAGVQAARNTIIAKNGIMRFVKIDKDYPPNSNLTVIQPQGY
jgi:hypothetical protein